MAYNLDPTSDSCYEGTTCLKNKLNIHNEEKLAIVEAQITFAKSVMLDEEPIKGVFGFEHLKQIHRFLFEDIYEWAGTTRSVNISKKRTNFLDAKLIEEVATKCFSKIENGWLDDLSFDEFSRRIAEFYNDVNHIHPFREGNGRTQRIYFSSLIRHYGYDINFSKIDTDELMIATIQASSGVLDYLVEFFKEAITTQQNQVQLGENSN